jgi:hypothetical protein
MVLKQSCCLWQDILHVIDCAKVGADVMTGPLSSIEGLLKHPLTDTQDWLNFLRTKRNSYTF